MRALTGAIITAGALIGLGLAAIGLGNRYQGVTFADHLRWRNLDTPLEMVLFLLIAAVLIGLALTFVGLSYHHERRHHERTRAYGDTDPGSYPKS